MLFLFRLLCQWRWSLCSDTTVVVDSCKARSQHDSAMRTAIEDLKDVSAIRLAWEINLPFSSSELGTRGSAYRALLPLLQQLATLVRLS